MENTVVCLFCFCVLQAAQESTYEDCRAFLVKEFMINYLFLFSAAIGGVAVVTGNKVRILSSGVLWMGVACVSDGSENRNGMRVSRCNGQRGTAVRRFAGQRRGNAHVFS